jgi:hypothetical protein
MIARTSENTSNGLRNVLGVHEFGDRKELAKDHDLGVVVVRIRIPSFIQ